MIFNTIPRLHNVSRHRMAAYLADPPSPVVLTQEMLDWPALKRWSFHYFAEHFGDFPVEACAPQFAELSEWVVRTDLRSYIDYLQNMTTGEIKGDWRKGDASSLKKSGESLYAGNFNPVNKKYGDPDRIFADVPEAPGFIDSWLNLLCPEFVADCKQLQHHHYVYLSGKGAYTPLHADFWDTHAFLAQVSGKKHATLFDPVYTDLLMSDPSRDVRKMVKDKCYDAVEVWTAELNPGELLIIPSRWLHAVETLEASITYSMDWIDGSNWESYVHYGKYAIGQRVTA